MNNKPQISIGIFSFNQSPFLKQALDSVNEQNGIFFELFIYEDASSDLSPKIIHEYKFTSSYLTEVKIHINEHNIGLAQNLNKFVTEVNSPWLLILAADDFLDQNCLNKYSTYLGSDLDVIWGDLEIVQSDSTKTGNFRPADTWQRSIANKFKKSRIPKNTLIYWNNFVPGGMTLVRTETVLDAGGWIPELKTEDFGLWLKIRKESKFKYIPTKVGHYRLVENSVSRKHIENVFDQAKMVQILIKEKKLTNFQGAILLDLRIIYTMLAHNKIRGLNFKRISEESKIRILFFLLAVPFSVFFPLIGVVSSQIRNILIRMKVIQ